MRDSENTPTFSRYTIEGTLGSGGMGTVYLAYHEILNRPVALKVPKRELSSSDHFVERFLREAKALGTLHHRNIVTVYDAGIENETPYIAMKYIAGKTLSDIILQHGQVEIEKVIRWGRQMADALAYLHDQQILHRDLKGANVIIDLSGDAIIADFGIAQIEADSSLTRGVLGTPAYMSPEQAMGKDLDARSDMHGLGVILYQALTGILPFQDENSLALIQKVIHETPQPILDIRPETPHWLAEIITKCLQKHPAHRYKDDRALIKAFDNGMTRPTRSTAMSFLPARRKADVVQPEPLKPQPSVRVLDLIRSKANTVYAGFEGEQTITIFDAEKPSKTSTIKKLLQYGIFLSFAALVALILVAPLTFSQLSGGPPAAASGTTEEPSSPPTLSSSQTTTSLAETRRSKGSQKEPNTVIAPSDPFDSAQITPADTALTLAIHQDSVPSYPMGSEGVQPLSILPLGSQPGELGTLIFPGIPTPQDQTSHEITTSPATAAPTHDLPATLTDLISLSTRRELLRSLEEYRKEKRIQYGNRKRVSQPDLAYIFLLNEKEEGMYAILVPSQMGWTDLYSGNTFTHDKGHFFINSGNDQIEIKDIDPIWLEVLSIDEEAEPAQLKRRVTGW